VVQSKAMILLDDQEDMKSMSSVNMIDFASLEGSAEANMNMGESPLKMTKQAQTYRVWNKSEIAKNILRRNLSNSSLEPFEFKDKNNKGAQQRLKETLLQERVKRQMRMDAVLDYDRERQIQDEYKMLNFRG
jgi:hypothetical protein